MGGGRRWWKGIVVDVEAVSREGSERTARGKYGAAHRATGRRHVPSRGRLRRRASDVSDIVKEGEGMSYIISICQVTTCQAN